MAELEIISVPAQVMNMNPRADRSWKLTFETRELSGDEVKVLADHYQGEGWLVFKPNADDIQLSEIPQTDADAGLESPSSRLRKRIWLLWDQGGRKSSFDNFYLATIGKFMEYIESRLEPKED